MSGTPAKETNIQSGTKSLLGLFRFIQNHVYGHQTGVGLWSKLIARPLTSDNDEDISCRACALVRLVASLSSVMIRHTKVDSAGLPPLICRTKALRPSEEEEDAYNAIVSFAKINIVLTSLGKKGFNDSLLNARNHRFAAEVMHNLRLSCCGGGRMIAQLTEKNRSEFLDLLQHKHKRPETDITKAGEFLGRVLNGMKTKCCSSACGHVSLLLPLVTPCVHFFCVDCFENLCVKTGNYRCLECREPFRYGSFSYLQPGFKLDWVGDEASTPLSNQPEVGLVGGTNPMLQSSKARYVIDMVESLHSHSKVSGAKGSTTFKCIVFSQFRNVLNLLGSQLILRFGQSAIAEFWGKYRKIELEKFTNGVQRTWKCTTCGYVNEPLEKRCGRQRYEVSGRTGSPSWSATVWADEIQGYFRGRVYGRGQIVSIPTPSWIVHLGDYVQATVVSGSRCNTSSAVGISQREKVDCFILLLSRDGSTGLDLSMVTHIILLDKIWDGAIEDQVISRAWRLGTRAEEINAIQLYMKGTVEQIMFDAEEKERNRKKNEETNDGKEMALMRYLFRNLKILKTDRNVGKREKKKRRVMFDVQTLTTK